jgi:hypothetical protein
MNQNEHTQFFGAPGEPVIKTPPVSPPNIPFMAAATPPPPLPEVEVPPKPKRDYTKLVGSLAIGTVAIGSVGFVSWAMINGEETPEVTLAAPAPVVPIIPEAPKEELVETPPPPVAEEKPAPPPPPVHRPVAAVPKPEPVPMAMPVLPDEIRIAKVSDDSEFRDAFLEAREQVGPGGLFEYKGQWYSTYSIEEWNRMPAEMREEFTNRIEPIVSPAEQEETPEAVVEAEPIVARLDTDNDGEIDTILSDKNHDGLADIVIKDEPGEGISSIMYIDKDNDGKLETAIPVSDEGQVLEERAETLQEPIEMHMQSTGSVAGSGELSEVVDLDTDGDNGLETATPLGQEDQLLMAQMEHVEILSLEDDSSQGVSDSEDSMNSETA